MALLLKLASSLLLLSAAAPAAAYDPEAPPTIGAVASESAVCSKVGTQLLKIGGSAADAMVGTVLCVGIVALHHSGIGGGGFMTIRQANGTYETVDFRETAPAAAHEDMFENNTQASLVGGLASGVPGELRGLEYIHNKYGKLPWVQVLQPVIKLARAGFIVTDELAKFMDAQTTPFLTEDPAWAIDFAPQGKRVQKDDIMTRKRYANTLEDIANYGVGVFYTGAMAKATIAAVQARNGIMTMADLANYTIKTGEAVHVQYHGHKLSSCNTPSSGVVALSALNILNGYGPLDNMGPLSTHRLDEAFKFAYGQRVKLGDGDFVAGMENYTANMLSSQTASSIRLRISNSTTHGTDWYDPEGLEVLDTPGTSFIATADTSGLAISLATTVNLIFGSHVMVPETGIVMNNQMNDFGIPGTSDAFGYEASPANFIRPGKRPLSSISPVIAETPDGHLSFSVGAAGGSRIITATVQAIVHLIDQKMSLPDALKQPRLHDQLIPSGVTFEYSFDNRTVDYMRRLHHNVSWVAPGQSSVQGVRQLPNGTFEAAGEPRQVSSGGFAI
ncbi:hypothetical protein CDD81_1642 [Ophiocordyceps australis]|uniref:Glutathione hydrolase n=1 Tax=Ophiocordyceps australis TaxID=1399860 RepID=A0A2C5XVJ0_9HYPO|nr:hypothetical protein CDD81_1642 [Ophiocordyceps australis]